MPSQFKWSLLGIPDHTGVMNVGGRIGAAQGPAAFRKALEKLRGRTLVQQTRQDLGNVVGLGSQAAENLRLATVRVREAAQTAPICVIVGGGHEHGFSHLKGVAEAFPGQTLGCINIDAHLDVRKPDPEITSGSPFYLALESGVLLPKNFVEFGIQSHCNSDALWTYVEARQVEVVPFARVRGWKSVPEFKSALNRLSMQCDRVVVSLDLDSASQAFAPGVSAPQAEGFSASEIIEMMEEAGRQEKVVSLGIFELNPFHDEGERTARLAATAAWHFIERKLGA